MFLLSWAQRCSPSRLLQGASAALPVEHDDYTTLHSVLIFSRFCIVSR